jgi:membrane fusion protein (multidrug efflux system)
MKRALALLLLPLTLVACAEPDAPESHDSPAPAEAKAIPVNVAVVDLAPFADELVLFGQLYANSRARIAAEIPGRIERVPVSEGDVVKKGKTLVAIDSRVAGAQLNQAKANAKAAETGFARVQKLHAKGLAAQADLDGAVAQRDQAVAALEMALANYSKAVIRAPVRGKITNVTATKGAYASPGQPLLELVDVSWVKVGVGVPERDVPYMKLGAPAKVTVQAFPGEAFPGIIGEVALGADPKTRSFAVPIGVKNDDGRLRPGMLAEVTLPRENLQGVVVVPRDAVLDEPGKKAVFVTDGRTAKKRYVELGATRGAFTVVRKGVEVGDKLIVLGHRQVVDGQRVDVKKEEACCRAQVTASAEAEGGQPG